jgi:hypothetical protein
VQVADLFSKPCLLLSSCNIKPLWFLFFFGGVTATAPSRDLTDNKNKEEGGLKQRRKQKEAAQGDPEPKKGNQALFHSLSLFCAQNFHECYSMKTSNSEAVE